MITNRLLVPQRLKKKIARTTCNWIISFRLNNIQWISNLRYLNQVEDESSMRRDRLLKEKILVMQHFPSGTPWVSHNHLNFLVINTSPQYWENTLEWQVGHSIVLHKGVLQNYFYGSYAVGYQGDICTADNGKVWCNTTE